jgi:hypothetical protein
MASAQPGQAAAVIAAVGFMGIAAFQTALALGAPLGRAAWGGTHVRLPTGLRIASVLATAVWVLAALVVLERGGFEASPLPPAVGRWGTWVLVILLPIGAIMNFASSSRWERFLWGPVALLLAGLCLVLARSPL